MALAGFVSSSWEAESLPLDTNMGRSPSVSTHRPITVNQFTTDFYQEANSYIEASGARTVTNVATPVAKRREHPARMGKSAMIQARQAPVRSQTWSGQVESYHSTRSGYASTAAPMKTSRRVMRGKVQSR
jgi:hypothetical protein